jgi:hypothetical protein
MSRVGGARLRDIGREVFLAAGGILEQRHGEAPRPNASERFRQAREAAALAVADLGSGRSTPQLGVSGRTARRRRQLGREAIRALLEGRP